MIKYLRNVSVVDRASRSEVPEVYGGIIAGGEVVLFISPNMN